MTREGIRSGWARWILDDPGPSLQLLFMDTFLKYLAFEVDDPHYDWTQFDLENDPGRMAETRSYLDATDPDLSAFEARGGKVISYFGWADTALNPLRTVQYLEDVGSTVGGTDDFFRLFMVPGMFHCAGGLGPDRFDAMSPLIAWVERGVAPDEIAAVKVRDGKVEMTRPLCPYPQVARYRGSGRTTEAKNFRCVEPAELAGS